jgi:hypothetical protein
MLSPRDVSIEMIFSTVTAGKSTLQKCKNEE